MGTGPWVPTASGLPGFIATFQKSRLTPSEVIALVEQAVAADVVLTTGGVSVGFLLPAHDVYVSVQLNIH